MCETNAADNKRQHLSQDVYNRDNWYHLAMKGLT